jgi:orotidine-5'-phosphate decarboxylase
MLGTMTTGSFNHRLREAFERQSSLLCVGLDPLPARFPSGFDGSLESVASFCRAIVDATADLVCAFKPQIAHFAALGAEDVLAALIRHIHEQHPGLPVILDAKRGDIGSTAERYALEAYGRYGADAVTLNPYMGSESLVPFLTQPERGAVVLCRTSNPGSNLIQSHTPEDPLYLRVARTAAESWNDNDNVMLVAGATYPDELASIRSAAPELPLLVPGVGDQGADLGAALKAGLDQNAAGVVISSSRAILYAGSGSDFADAARARAQEFRDQINGFR